MRTAPRSSRVPALLVIVLGSIARADTLALELEGAVLDGGFSTGPFQQAQQGDAVRVWVELALPGAAHTATEWAFDAEPTASHVDVAGWTCGLAQGDVVLAWNDAGAGGDGVGALLPLDFGGAFLVLDLTRAAGDLWSSPDLAQAQGDWLAGAFDHQNCYLAGNGEVLALTLQRLSIRLEPAGHAFCAASACPCGNVASADAGCANSTGAGARLDASGGKSVAAADLALDVVGLPPGAAALLFVGAGAPLGAEALPFGDGERCVGGPLRRLSVRGADAAGHAAWDAAALAAGGWTPGSTRRFQVWYADPGASPCGAGVNLSSGVEVTFTP